MALEKKRLSRKRAAVAKGASKDSADGIQSPPFIGMETAECMADRALDEGESETLALDYLLNQPQMMEFHYDSEHNTTVDELSDANALFGFGLNDEGVFLDPDVSVNQMQTTAYDLLLCEADRRLSSGFDSAIYADLSTLL